MAVGQNGATRAVDLEPDEPAVSVPVGRQAIWGAGQDKCLQFPAEAGEETYVIGVQSTSLENTNNLTPVRLIVSTSEPDSAGAGYARCTADILEHVGGQCASGLVCNRRRGLCGAARRART